MFIDQKTKRSISAGKQSHHISDFCWSSGPNKNLNACCRFMTAILKNNQTGNYPQKSGTEIMNKRADTLPVSGQPYGWKTVARGTGMKTLISLNTINLYW